jgi:hypothetical protein
LLAGLNAAFPLWANDVAVNPFGKSPRLHSLPADEVRQKIFTWLDERGAADGLREQVASLWSSAGEPSGVELLEVAASAFALGDDRANQLVELCRRPRSHPLLPDQSWLAEPDLPKFEQTNLRLYYGRWLAQQNLFDESMEQLEGLPVEEVIDPATLLFYQAVSYHRLLRRDEGLKCVHRLLDDVSDSAARYTAVARLMEADLQTLEEESLDHIARRMQDIERRLDLGRPGPKTRAVEEGVIASLDKLIKELEEQQQQQQQQASAGGSLAPQTPASDSRILGGSGRGETTRRNLGDTSGWGSLPPKERQDALQQIGKDFPSHYRDAVEQYFRRLATDEQQPGKE